MSSLELTLRSKVSDDAKKAIAQATTKLLESVSEQLSKSGDDRADPTKHSRCEIRCIKSKRIFCTSSAKRTGRMTPSKGISQQSSTDWTQQCNHNRAQDLWRQRSSSLRTAKDEEAAKRGQVRRVEPWQEADVSRHTVAEQCDAWRETLFLSDNENESEQWSLLGGNGPFCVLIMRNR